MSQPVSVTTVSDASHVRSTPSCFPVLSYSLLMSFDRLVNNAGLSDDDHLVGRKTQNYTHLFCFCCRILLHILLSFASFLFLMFFFHIYSSHLACVPVFCSPLGKAAVSMTSVHTSSDNPWSFTVRLHDHEWIILLFICFLVGLICLSASAVLCPHTQPITLPSIDFCALYISLVQTPE